MVGDTTSLRHAVEGLTGEEETLPKGNGTSLRGEKREGTEERREAGILTWRAPAAGL